MKRRRIRCSTENFRATVAAFDGSSNGGLAFISGTFISRKRATAAASRAIEPRRESSLTLRGLARLVARLFPDHTKHAHKNMIKIGINGFGRIGRLVFRAI